MTAVCLLCFVRRIFELFAAIAGNTEIICQYRDGGVNQTREALAKHPVNSKKAECSSKADKELIDGYIAKLDGGHSELDKKLTETIKNSNTDPGL